MPEAMTCFDSHLMRAILMVILFSQWPEIEI